MQKKQFKSIAMLSTHGYFDAVPTLGRTDTGGQVVYVLELAKALGRMGIKVDIYTRWFDKNDPQITTVPGSPNARVIKIRAGEWEFVPKEFIYDLLPELANNMIAFIDKNNLKYDLYNGHYVDAGIVALDVAKRKNKPCYFTPHSLGGWKKDQMGGDPEEMEKKFNFKLRISEEMKLFKAVNGLSLTTQVQYEKLNELYKYDADNIDIIAPGVDIYRYNIPDEKILKIDTKTPEKYIFCLSRIDSNKGHDLLLNAFALVKDKIKDVDLVIGGGSPNPKPRELEVFAKMDEIIEKNKMADRVHKIGYVSDEMMGPLYQQSQLFVLPSLFEPFGMTTQEAMACGKAVIASKFGGIRNVITHGKDGMLVDSANPQEFADALFELLSDDSKRNAMGKAARALIEKEYSWEAIANKFLDFYQKYE
ncbi:MAG: glycosyltransferase [Bacteroidales bacterium]|nr:glycosyltransferase [Bacteroidales bacterium]MCF8404707.1 glycosyltransferase [Bacteroidales bacterium]